METITQQVQPIGQQQEKMEFAHYHLKDLSQDTVVKVTKGMRLHDIRTGEEGTKLWFTMNDLTTSEFKIDHYKNDEMEGKLTLSLHDNDTEALNAFDKMVFDAVLKNSDFRTIDNMMLTRKTWEMFFKKSMYNNSIRASVTKGAVAFFDHDAVLMDEEHAWRCLSEGTRINCVVEPCYLWFMTDNEDKRAGITWKVRQVRFLDEPKIEEPVEWRMCLSDDD